MTWHDDLRHIEWNGRKFTVLDKIQEGGRGYLGLALFDEVAATAKALDAGRGRILPSDLTWVEEKEGTFLPLSRRQIAEILKRKSERAADAFRRK